MKAICLSALLCIGVGAFGCGGGDSSGGGGDGGTGSSTSTTTTSAMSQVEIQVLEVRLHKFAAVGSLSLEVKASIDNQSSGSIPLSLAHFQVKTDSGLLVSGSPHSAMLDGYCADSIELSSGSQHDCTVEFDIPDDERATALLYDAGAGLTSSADIPARTSGCPAWCKRLGEVSQSTPCPDDSNLNLDFCLNDCERILDQWPQCTAEKEASLACDTQGAGTWKCDPTYGLLYMGMECLDETVAAGTCQAN